MKDNLSEAELGYIAGIIDGEGCIGIHKQHHKGTRLELYSRTLILEIQNTNLDMILWLQGRLGGSIGTRDREGNRKIAHRISWSANDAISILKAISKYLVAKRQQASWGIMLQELKNERCHPGSAGFSNEEIAREEFIYEQLTRLNKRGSDGT